MRYGQVPGTTARVTLLACSSVVVAALLATGGLGHVWPAGQHWLATGGLDGILALSTIVIAGALAWLAASDDWRTSRHHLASLARVLGREHGLRCDLPPGRVGTLAGFAAQAGLREDAAEANACACMHPLTRHLGPKVGQVQGWPPHVRQVAAVILDHGSARRDRETGLADRIARFRRSAGRDGAVDPTPEVNLVIDREWGKLSRSLQEHAYVSTALMAVLTRARQHNGVLSTSDFGWLKDVDRELWYALQAVGRPAPHVEGAAATTHHRAERVARRPLERPHLRELAASMAPRAEAALLERRVRPGRG